MGHHRCSLHCTLLIGLFLGVLCDAGWAADAPKQQQPIRATELAVQRIRLTSEQLKQVLANSEQPLRQLSRPEFEAQLRRARRRLTNPPEVPRLVEASYQATLEGVNLVGSATWRLRHTGRQPGWFPITDLQLALRKAAWKDEQPVEMFPVSSPRRPDNPPPGGSNPAQPSEWLLHVEPSDVARIFHFDWSARGVEEPDSLRFDLRMPRSTIAKLELRLPKAVTPNVSEGVFLSGPEPDPAANWQRWELTFGGHARLYLNLGRSNRKQRGERVIVAQTQTEQQLLPGLARCKFEFDLQVYRGQTRELLLDCTPGLQVTEVILNNLESWQLRASKQDRSKYRLQIRLRDPLVGGKLVVHALMPVPSEHPAATWTSPQIRFVQAIEQSETLTLVVSPQLELHSWQPGDYAVVRNNASEDGTRTLSLEPSLAPSETQSLHRRPQLRFASPTRRYQLRQEHLWRITCSEQRLTSKLSATFTQGVPGPIVLRLPPGFTLEPSPRPSSPTYLLEDPHTVVLVVPPSHRSNQTWEWQLEARAALRGPIGETRKLPLPSYLSQDGGTSEAYRLQVQVAPVFQAKPELTHGRLLATFPGVETLSLLCGGLLRPGLLQQQVYRTWQGEASGQPFAGSLVLSSPPVSFTVTSQATVHWYESAIQVDSQLHVSPEQGWLDTLVLSSGAKRLDYQDCQVLSGNNPIEAVMPSPFTAVLPSTLLLGSQGPLHSLLTQSLQVSGQWPSFWQLHFTQPLSEPIALRLHQQTTNLRGPLPLVHVVGARQQRSRAMIQSDGIQDVQIQSVPRHAIRRHGDDWTFTTSADSFQVTVTSSFPDASRSVPQFTSGQLDSYLSPDGRILCRFRIQVSDWDQPTLPVELAAQARPLGFALGGKWLHHASLEHSSKQIWQLPYPMNVGTVSLEVVYELLGSRPGVRTFVQIPLPVLPVPLGGIRCHWHLAPGLQALPPAVPLPGLVAHSAGSLGQCFDILGQWFRSSETPTNSVVDPMPIPETTTGSRRVLDWFDAVARAHDAAESLVVDTLALHGLGYTPDQSVPTTVDSERPLASLGLVLLRSGQQLILTSFHQEVLWRTSSASAQGIPSSVRNAARQAVQSQCDPSGRFCTLAQWWRHDRLPSYGNPEEVMDVLNDDHLGNGSRWQTEAQGRFARLSVVAEAEASWLGWTIALVLGGVTACLMGLGWRGRWAFLTGWLLLSGSAFIWLPSALVVCVEPIALTGLVVAGWATLSQWFAGSPAPRRDNPEVRGRSLRQSALARRLVVLVLLGLGMATHAQEIELPKVYLFRLKDAKQPEQVLISESLLERITQACQARDPRPTVLLRSVKYHGTPEAGRVHFEAIMELDVQTELSEPVRIPLGPVNLTDTQLDGKEVLPETDQTNTLGQGFRIPIRTVGRHILKVQFTVPIQTDRGLYEVDFQVPEIPFAQLSFTAPNEVKQLRLRSWRGAWQQQIQDNQRILRADLGRATRIRLHWRIDGPERENPVLRIDEASVWYLSPAKSRLISLFDYRVDQGSLTRLRVRIPAGLELTQLKVQGQDGNRPDPATGWVRDWQLLPLEDAAQLLEVSLQIPLSGRGRLVLELFPRRRLSTRPRLGIPTSDEEGNKTTYVGYHLDKLELVEVSRQEDFRDYPEEVFQDSLWRNVPFVQDLLPPDEIYQRLDQRSAPLQPQLAVTRPVIEVRQDLQWTVDTRQAQVVAQVNWTSNGRALSSLEWTIPPGVKLRTVTGDGLEGWFQEGRRVQAWLLVPRQSIELRLEAEGEGLPYKNRRIQVWNLPQLLNYSDNVQTAQTTLQIIPNGSWWIQEDKRNLHNLTGSPLPGNQQGRRFRGKSDRYGGKIGFYGLAKESEFALLQRLASNPRGLTHELWLQASFKPRRPQAFRLEIVFASPLQTLAAEPTELALPRGWQAYPEPADASTRSWIIEASDLGQATPLATLRLRTPMRHSWDRAWHMPQVRLSHAASDETASPHPSARVRQWLVLTDRSLEVTQQCGVQTAAKNTLPKAFQAALTPLDNLRIWTTHQADCQLRGRQWPASFAVRPSLVFAFMDLGLARVSPGGIGRAQGFLYAAEAGVLEGELGLPGRILQVYLDLQPRPVADDRRFTAAIGPGYHQIDVYWQCPEVSAVPRSKPRWFWQGEPVAPKRWLWTWQLPSFSSQATKVARPVPAADADQLRIEALLELGERQLWEHRLGSIPIGSGALTPLPMAKHWMQAWRLTRPASMSSDPAPSLEERLSGLSQAWPVDPKFASLHGPVSASVRPPYHASFRQGIPVCFAGTDPLPVSFLSPFPKESQVTLAQDGGLDRIFRESMLVTLSISLFILWLLAGPKTRPEQAALIGLLGLLMLDVPVGLVLLVVPILAMIYRIGWLLASLVRWMRLSQGSGELAANSGRLPRF